MAIVCDYCGDVTESTDRVTVAFGHEQEIALKGATAREWFYYCDDECADAVKVMLANMRLFALHGEGSGLTWQLVEQAVAPVGNPAPSETIAVDETGSVALADEGNENTEPPMPASLAEYEDFERLRRLPLSHWVSQRTEISPVDAQEREASGTPMATVISHSATLGKLRKAGIVTLEDAVGTTRVEFAGINGVGARVLSKVANAAAERGLCFREGPSADQLGNYLRCLREKAEIDPNELGARVALALGAPARRDGDCRPKAWSQAESTIVDCEAGSKPLSAVLLDAVAVQLGTTRSAILEGARSGVST